MKPKKALMLVVILASSLGAVSIGWRAQVFEILEKEGPTAAVKSSQRAYFEDRDFKSLFQLAWSLYANGQLTRADGLVNKILYQENWQLSDKEKANAFYLRGVIQHRRGNFPEAIGYYFRAKALYESLGEHSNVYKVNLFTANLYIDMADTHIAESILEDTLVIAEEYGLQLGIWYSIYSKAEFMKANYANALDLIEKAYDEYLSEDNMMGQVESLSNMGFYTMLLGDLEGGMEITLQAEELINQIDDNKNRHYNLINMALYNRCSGSKLGKQQQRQFVHKINHWADQEDDSEILWYLQFVQNFDCNQLQMNVEAAGGPTAPPPDNK